MYFVELELRDAQGKTVSRNFYWKPNPAFGQDLTALNQLPMVTLQGGIARHDVNGRVRLTVTLTNPTNTMALMAHVQLRQKISNQRVLPVFYSVNYVSLSRVGTLCPDCTDVFIRGETFEGLESSGEVVGGDELLEMGTELIAAVVEEAFDGGTSLMVRFMRSTCPLVQGWLGRVSLCSMSLARHTPVQGVSTEAGGRPLAILRQVGELDIRFDATTRPCTHCQGEGAT